MKSTERAQSRLLRAAVWLALAGLACLAFFLWRGLSVLTMGIGVVLGLPLMMLAVCLYLIAVVRDLRRRGAL